MIIIREDVEALKKNVYQTRPINFSQLKAQIEENIANIPENTYFFFKVMSNNKISTLVEYIFSNK